VFKLIAMEAETHMLREPQPADWLKQPAFVGATEALSEPRASKPYQETSVSNHSHPQYAGSIAATSSTSPVDSTRTSKMERLAIDQGIAAARMRAGPGVPVLGSTFRPMGPRIRLVGSGMDGSARATLASAMTRTRAMTICASAVLLFAAAAARGADPPDNPAIKALLAEMDLPAPAPATMIWRDTQLFNPGTAANRRSDAAAALWKRFRAAHPLGFQGVAISTVRSDGTCSVVISEPPPHVALLDIRRIVPDAAIVSQGVGHGGALFDVIGNLRGGKAVIAGKLALLNQLLFDTDYGAFVYSEPFNANWKAARAYNLDIRATASEIHGWLYSDGARFRRVEGDASISLAQLLDSKDTAVFELADSALVLWWIPRLTVISNSRPEIRQFALATDLVVGAVADHGGVMLLGRQRATPYEILPPLRTETIVLLAAVSAKDQLEQSYQRMHPGAGTYNLEWDWAPILLSPELVDTEYGDLLNHADQLLKGWSQHGETKYEQFNYEQPSHWAFDKPLLEIILAQSKESQLTFNWNTTGTGYVVPFESSRVFALLRTGALPVSFIPGDNSSVDPLVASYEDKAFEWYAGLNNPILVRVVQYAAIFQAFHRFSLNAVSQPPPVSTGPSRAFAQAMERFWQSVQTISSLDGLASADASHQRFARYVARTKREERFVSDLAQEVARREIADSYESWRKMDASERRNVVVASMNLDMSLTRSSFAGIRKARVFLTAMAAKQKLPQAYANSVKPTGRSWIHTPVIVLSNPGTKHWDWMGGHNLRAAATAFESDFTLPRGMVRIRNSALELNPMDIDRAPSILRTAARGLHAGEEKSTLTMRLSRELALAPPARNLPPRQALMVPPGKPASSSMRHLVLSTLSDPPPVVRRLAAAANPEHVVLLKQDGVYWLKSPGSSSLVPASNLADATELASLRLRTAGKRLGPAKAELSLYNLSKADQEIVLENMSVNAKRRGFSEDVIAVAREERTALPKLSPDKYDFTKASVRIHDPILIEGERIAKVTVEVPPKVGGIRSAVIEFWIKIKGAIADADLKNILTAVKIRAEQMFGRVARGELQSKEATVLLQQEMNRLGRFHPIEIRTHVRDAAGDWHLAGCDRRQVQALPV